MLTRFTDAYMRHSGIWVKMKNMETTILQNFSEAIKLNEVAIGQAFITIWKYECCVHMISYNYVTIQILLFLILDLQASYHRAATYVLQ